jgi:tetratricopeptide (TPR) repeat protein
MNNSVNASMASPVSYTQTHVGQVVEETVLSSSISLKPWNPKAPYLSKLRKAQGPQKYKTYLNLKKQYHASPAFYTDVAEYFRRIKSEELSLRILSNLAELELESPELLRVLGNKLMDYRQFPEAIYFFRKVLTFKGEDAQSSRDLGLALEAGGEYDEAVKTLYSVITSEIERHFDGIKLIVMNDINRILAVHPQTSHRYIDKRLIRKEPVDVRVVLTWDLDDTDMDLWVTDPRGETCTYSNTLTEAGGKITRDITQGFGPEEFMIRKALKGTYTVKAHWYGSSSQDMLVPANLHVTFYTHHGRRQGKQKEITIRLEEKNEEITVGQFDFR